MPAWLREEQVYARHPAITPLFLSEAYAHGRVVVLREQPAEVVWLRPNDDDWPGLEDEAKAVIHAPEDH